MAFLKRTWLARIGTGLNKFLIGDKDGEGKQTLTNSPDSVTQQGDVISAENLNDLEDRIDSAITELDTTKADTTDVNLIVNGTKLTKLWENPNPSASFVSQQIPLASLETDFVLAYRQASGYAIEYLHLSVDDTQLIFTLKHGRGAFQYISFYSRTITVNNTGSTTVFNVGSGSVTTYVISSSPSYDGQADDSAYVPIAIYKVGNIYTT